MGIPQTRTRFDTYDAIALRWLEERESVISVPGRVYAFQPPTTKLSSLANGWLGMAPSGVLLHRKNQRVEIPWHLVATTEIATETTLWRSRKSCAVTVQYGSSERTRSSSTPHWKAGAKGLPAEAQIELAATVDRFLGDMRLQLLSYASRLMHRVLHQGEAPAPRLILDPYDAEIVAAEWMRWMGFRNASVTRKSRDEGIDVAADEAVAQVKAEMNPTGRPAVQQLYGAAAYLRRDALFFALNGYSVEAMQWATAAGVALFRFDLQGRPRPLNERAVSLFTGERFLPTDGEVSPRRAE